MLSKSLRPIKSFLLKFLLIAWLLIFNLLCPLKDIFAKSVYEWHKLTYDGRISSIIHLNDNNAEGYSWFASQNFPDSTAYVACINSQGEIIDSTNTSFYETISPYPVGPSAINAFGKTYVFISAGNTIYVKDAKGQNLFQKTFDNLKGRFWSVSSLCQKGNIIKIVLLTDYEYQEGGQSQHDTFVYSFDYDLNNNALDISSGNWPIGKNGEFNKAYSNNKLAIYPKDNLIIFTITPVASDQHSKIYRFDFEGNLIGENNIGTSTARGPALVEEADSLKEITIGGAAQDSGYVYSFNRNGNELASPFSRPGEVLSHPIRSDLDGDGYAETIFTIYNYPNATLCVLDGKTRSLVWGFPISGWGFGVREIISADINKDGKNEIIFCKSNEIYILNYLGQIVDIIPLESKFYYSDASMFVDDIDNDRKGELVVALPFYEGVDPDAKMKTDVYIIKLGQFDTINSWPMRGQNIRNTNCLTIKQRPEPVPAEDLFILSPCYPNPSEDGPVTININLKEPSIVKIDIYNVNGEKVKSLFEGELPEGINEKLWDGKNEQGKTVASGIYFYKVKVFMPQTEKQRAQEQTKTRKMLLLNVIFMFIPLIGLMNPCG